MRESKYTKELLNPIIENSFSIGEVLTKLGLKQTGGNHRHIQSRIIYLELDTSHFLGRGWAKGKTKETSEIIRKNTFKIRIPDENVFVEKSSYPSSKLSKRLLEIKWEYKCEICNINEWNGKRISLHVDHINGNHTDYRLENLRFLCPNCHQQTKTWGSKNKRG